MHSISSNRSLVPGTLATINEDRDAETFESVIFSLPLPIDVAFLVGPKVKI